MTLYKISDEYFKFIDKMPMCVPFFWYIRKIDNDLWVREGFSAQKLTLNRVGNVYNAEFLCSEECRRYLASLTFLELPGNVDGFPVDMFLPLLWGSKTITLSQLFFRAIDPYGDSAIDEIKVPILEATKEE